MGKTSTLTVADASWIARGACLVIEGERLRVIAVRGATVEVGRWRWRHTAGSRLRRFAAWSWLWLRITAEELRDGLTRLRRAMAR